MAAATSAGLDPTETIEMADRLAGLQAEAGKTTCLRAIAGLLPHSGGSVLLEGRPLGNLGPERTSRLGVQFIPEGGGVLRGLSVTENLLLAGWAWGRKRAALAPRLDRAFGSFPVLAERRHQPASTLSG